MRSSLIAFEKLIELFFIVIKVTTVDAFAYILLVDI